VVALASPTPKDALMFFVSRYAARLLPMHTTTDEPGKTRTLMRERAADDQQDSTAKQDAGLAFEMIFAKYRWTFIKIASTFESDPELRQDLLQEIALSVWQAMTRFRGESALKTFVYRVAYNRALNHVAKQSRLLKKQEIDEAHISDHPAPPPHDESDHRVDKLMSAIRQLPIIQRQLVTLSLEKLTYAGISEVMGLSESNVGVKLHGAKAKLKN
jgi:RNA polymerase sigma factor (sigma-70 family)